MSSELLGATTPWQCLHKKLGEARTEEQVTYDLAAAHLVAHTSLAEEIIARIHAQPPDFFENLVIDVLLAMGYGGQRAAMARHLGCSGDGGVDGFIAQDELGLDLIYLQAKRLRPGVAVPVSEVRDFAGSLDAHQAAKGIFVTTSHFSESAMDFVQRVSRRVVLVDGYRFSGIMIRHNIGVWVKESYQIKRIDANYFSTAAAAKRKLDIISASIQPRR